MFYSKTMFKLHLNPMEAVYVCSLVLFSITIFLFLTYINNWFRTYRNKTTSAIQSFKFPENTSSISESYQRMRMEELQNLHNMKADESPKSLKYNEPSVESVTQEEEEPSDESPSKEKKTDPIIENDHIMNYIKVQPVYRDTLFVSCACAVVGSLLVVHGLNSHLLSYTMLCLSVITPVATTIVYHSKIGCRWELKPDEFDEQADMVYEFGYLLATILVVALISDL